MGLPDITELKDPEAEVQCLWGMMDRACRLSYKAWLLEAPPGCLEQAQWSQDLGTPAHFLGPLEEGPELAHL